MTSAPTRLAVGLAFLFAVLAGPVGLARGATVTEDFSDFDGTQWVVGQDSFWNEGLQNFYLAPARDDQRGRLYYATPFTVSSFTASFDYHILAGSGADGLTFAFVRDPNYTTSGNEGGHLDFTGADGYAVEFDTYSNSWDPYGRHIAVIRDSTRNHLAYVKTETRGTHHAEIRFSLGNLAVVFDGNEVLTYQIPDFVPFLGYFGFTAATGDSNDNHVIDNVVIATEEECDVLTGRVLFEDNSTPVRIPGGPRVRVVAYHRESKERFPVLVDDNSEYQFAPGRLPEGTYDLAAIYNLPAGFVHPNYSPLVWQPYDTDPAPDFTVSADGVPSNCQLDIRFPWPAILLHGVINPLWNPFDSDTGPNDFQLLQPYISNADRNRLRTDPQKGIISLVPDMTRDGHRDIDAYYENLEKDVPLILSYYTPATKFKILAFSQGGLVTRKLVQETIDNLTPDRIAKVMQVATPNRGTCVANNSNPGWPTWLTQDRVDAFNAVINDGRGVRFYVIAGALPFCFPFFNGCLFNDYTTGCIPNEPHDGVVPVRSVFYLGWPDLPGYNVVAKVDLKKYWHADILEVERVHKLIQVFLANP